MRACWDILEVDSCLRVLKVILKYFVRMEGLALSENDNKAGIA